MDKLDDVWGERDFPVLLEVARRIDAADIMPNVQAVADAVGLPVEQVQLAGAALKRRGLVDAVGSLGNPVVRFRELSGEAYLLTGLHPNGDDAVSALVSALRQAADQAKDPEEKSRLRSLADGALGVTREVLAGVLTAAIAHQAGV